MNTAVFRSVLQDINSSATDMFLEDLDTMLEGKG